MNHSTYKSTPKLGELEFRRFQKLIFDAAGIHLAVNKIVMVEGRLTKRLKALSLIDFMSYLRYIEGNAEEHQLAVDLLTTNETYFFRETKHFDFLREQILPQHRKGTVFKVWSAACSSGEEPFSIAMLLADVLGKNDWSILASDISTQVLARARLGHYPLSRTEQIPLDYLKRFCLRGVDSEAGTLLVDRSLQQRVDFRQINLMDFLGALPEFDLVLLRNVLIYFNADIKREVVKRVIGRIKPEGHLFVGHSETLSGLDTNLIQVAPAIYRKPS